MPAVEAPTIADFQPVIAYRTALGMEYLRMVNDDLVQLDLSQDGAAAIDADPAVAGLIERMAGLTAAHNGYRDVRAVKAREPGEILRVAEKGMDTYHKGKRLASVYHPEAVPDTIVKAYDYDMKSAGFQFYAGDWMQSGLAAANDGIYAPRQFALMTAPFGLHRTAVMEYLPGLNLRVAATTMGIGDLDHVREVNAMVEGIAIGIRHKISRALGWRGLLMTNDLRYNFANIMVPEPDTLTCENAGNREYGVIDQPVVKYRNLPVLSLMRFLPGARRFPARPALLAPQPVGSEAI